MWYLSLKLKLLRRAVASAIVQLSAESLQAATTESGIPSSVVGAIDPVQNCQLSLGKVAWPVNAPVVLRSAHMATV